MATTKTSKRIGERFRKAEAALEKEADKVFRQTIKLLVGFGFTKNYAEIVAEHVADDWMEGQANDEFLDMPWCFNEEDEEEDIEEDDVEEEVEEAEEEAVEEPAE